MSRLPPRYRQHAFAVIQSAITCAVATAIASPAGLATGALLAHWFGAWAVAWLTMLPVVLLAAPWIRRLSDLIVQDAPRDRR